MNIKIILSLIGLSLISACGADKDKPPEAASAEPEYALSGSNPEACEKVVDGINWQAVLNEQCHRLSDYGLFVDNKDPRSGVKSAGISYQLNSELFTDYARKYRYVILPEGKTMAYTQQEVFSFPIGTVLVKVFALPEDTALAAESLVEVRLLIHRERGWQALPYKWYSELEEGYFHIVGDDIPFQLSHNGELREGNYAMPTYGSCQVCHQVNNQVAPIGLKARHLNVHSETGLAQLQSWSGSGVLAELPDNDADIEYAPDWRDDSQPLQQRAKAYLDINCAHCHREEGAASLSGLKLEFDRTTVDYNHGVCNSAHGWRGGGFDIWPGDGGNSSLPLRMELNAATDRMPPIGRSISDSEAVALMREWIDAMPYQECAR